MLLYIMRHGTTDWNEQLRLQGNSNTCLNENGKELARKTAQGLADVTFNHIYSSPLSRAYETASIIAEGRGLNVIKDDRLIEVGFGIDEGVVPQKRTEGCALFFKDPANYKPAEGAESLEHLCSRAKDFIDNVILPLSDKEPDSTVLITGHGALNKALMVRIMDRELKDFWAGNLQRNCSVAIVEVKDGKFNLLEDGVVYY
ncbi:MAG: histidine phosphatase family protein [Lachnospiraceae bacterium]|nr:histidine phosphatase family protein [Lachnospiraceae bacterium]